MRRPLKVILVMSALAAVAASAAGCGTENIKVSKSDQPLHRGVVLFSERCSGCHTLSYAATHGSASNVRNAEVTNGPNLDQRCERPVTRVLYAIQNGGFSGAIMPQNVVVGQDARDVAEFVSKYAGSMASKSPGVPPCQSQPVGTLPPPSQTGTGGASSSTTTASTSATTTTSSGNGGKKQAKPKS